MGSFLLGEFPNEDEETSQQEQQEHNYSAVVAQRVLKSINYIMCT